MTDLANHLRRADIFDQLTPTQLEMVANVCREVSFTEGEVILEEGASGKELYVIVEGEVEVVVNPAIVGPADSPHQAAVIATLRQGQSFGEIALVDEGLRSATVRATFHGAKLLVIPREKLMMLCETYPELGYRLMYNLAADLAMKIRNADLQIRATLLYQKKE
jgi:CRP-like cAMP-binding protein